MKIIVHAGPHRTATTSIQSVLAASRLDLVKHGIWYPEGSAHHVLAWKVLERDLSALGATEDTRTAGEVLNSWIAEARNNDCETILLSSEDFAVLRDLGWHVLRSSSPEVESWKLVAAHREPSALAESAYSHLLLNGLAQEWEEVREVLAEGSQDFYDYLDVVHDRSEWSEVEVVEYHDDAEHFVREMCSALVGKRAAKRVVARRAIPHLNARLDRSMWAPLLDFNRLNTPKFVLDLETGEFPEDFYELVVDELPKIAWVAELIRSVARASDTRQLAS